MRTEEITIYEFHELSEKAKQKAIENVRESYYVYNEFSEWVIDDCCLLEPPHKELENLFGDKYKDKYSTFQSMLSRFTSKIKKSKKRIRNVKNEIINNKEETNSSFFEESEKIDNNIITKSNLRKSFMPPAKEKEDISTNNKNIFFISCSLLMLTN